MNRARLGIFASIATGSVVLAAASCSLDLDESKIGASQEAGLFDTFTPEEASVDAGDGGADATTPAVTTCAKDEDCPSNGNACLKGRCDLSRKSCVYDVCRPSACNAAACDVATKTCGAPTAYKYKVTQWQVGAPISRIAAVYPFVFVLRATGVVAYDVSNPTATPPPEVPVFGIGFVPTQMVATANRVFFMTSPSGPPNVTPSRLPIAWLDVPTDPFVTRLDAKTVVPSYSRPANEAVGLAVHGDDTALLIGGGAAQNFPSSIVAPPITEPFTITATPIAFTAGQSPFAVSGTRLIMEQIDGNGSATFGTITGVGTTTPLNAGNYSFADAGPVTPPQNTAASADGAVFWSIASLNMPPGQPGVLTRAVRGQFLLPNATGDFDRPGGLDLEVYGAPAVGQGANVAGPVAMLDATTAMALVAAKENPGAQTAVVFAKRNPLSLVLNDNMTPRRIIVPVALGTFVGAAAANGIGYAAANEGGIAPNATIYAFDPACPVQ